MTRYLFTLLSSIILLTANASERQWQTHFAYNSVTQIATFQNEVYAVANGKLFSINQTSEALTLYNNFSGMHGIHVAQLCTDTAREQLLLLYADGKMDIMRHRGDDPQKKAEVVYVSDLYSKPITGSKRCNNITIQDSMAYLSMDFGILTFNLENYSFVDCYYIGSEASDVRVEDILLRGDSIYAKTAHGVYAAHLQDNIVDYRYWHLEANSQIAFDEKKGKVYLTSDGSQWSVAGTKGVERHSATGEKLYYLPDGPLVNTPYNLKYQDGHLYMVPGGRWVNQYKTPGNVMILADGKWSGISNSTIQSKTGQKATDFTDIAIDPYDASHYFITSYGTGLYEFKGTELVNHYTPSNSIIGSAAPDSPDRYTRTDGAMFDADSCLWVAVAGGVDTTLVAITPDGKQHGLNIYSNSTQRFFVNTPGGLLVDKLHPNRKWLVSCRSEAAIIVLDDGGTKFDPTDDQCKVHTEFYDQDGQVLLTETFHCIAQEEEGDIWIGSNVGPIIIPAENDTMQTNVCKRLRIVMPDGTYLMESEQVNAFAWDDKGNIWIGTQGNGVYVLDNKAENIVACYTSDNSVMPSNTVSSLAYDDANLRMYIGTSEGLVSYIVDPDAVNDPTMGEGDMNDNFGQMYRWRAHNAFSQVEEVVMLGDTVYGLSSNSLFMVDKVSGEVRSLSQLDGLSASSVSHISYNPTLNSLLITYLNGQIDIITSNGDIHNISDLYLKQMNGSKMANDIYMKGEKAYLGMDFGILVINMRKYEIEGTYYIGEESNEVAVLHLTLTHNRIYALTANSLYYADLSDNLMDYTYWHKRAIPAANVIGGIETYNGNIYAVFDRSLYRLNDTFWSLINISTPSRSLCKTGDELYFLPHGRGVGKFYKDGDIKMQWQDRVYSSIWKDGNNYWLGTEKEGLVHRIGATQAIETYRPNGPISNYSYKLRFVDDKLYMLPGGRWANDYKRQGDIMIMEDEEWRNITYQQMVDMLGNHKVRDLMNVAQDPKDEQHYFVSSYGTGLYEFYNDSIIELYLPDNSTLQSAIASSPNTYTRTDGMLYDDQGNLWVLNMGGNGVNNINILTPEGRWHAYNLNYKRARIEMNTAGDILVDKRNSTWKWIPLLRYNQGLILLQDNGTPIDPTDDKVTYTTSWIDQNKKQVIPSTIHAIAQDGYNTLWIGTSSGIIVIPAAYDFTTSNRCKRVVIPRNDGTQLGDYLLDNEQVNDIQIDGANRLWVATANSGVYLLEQVGDILDDHYTVETVAHFTTENSILPSNTVLSIAIHPYTGEVFFGTGAGLVSYMSDATSPEEDFSTLYAYPNPVRPSYQGQVMFQGTVDQSVVRILDASGQVVKVVEAHGGTAVWDMRNTVGKRVGTGVYTAICHSADGTQHGSTKVLIIN